MARLLTLLALVAATATVAHAQGSGGLVGDLCDNDSACLSRTCSAGLCTATTCGLSPTNGGVGTTMPTDYCSTLQVYNPARVCAFGYGKCTRAECCDTVSCAEGVSNSAKSGYCATGYTFSGTRLCPGGVCTQAACCIQTKCDGAGGVPVTARSTYCPTGQIFNNAGVCAAGPGLCTTSTCCMLDVRTCGTAYTSASPPPACVAPSVMVPTRLFDPTAADGRGGCCETTTCATGVLDSAKTTYCSTYTKTTFSGTSVCSTGTCSQSDCCQLAKGACDGNAIKSGSTCTCPSDKVGANKYYLIGTGCVCVPGTYLETTGLNAGKCVACPYGSYSVGAKAQTCTVCPAEQPYTPNTGADAPDHCVNYCDEVLNNGGAGSSGACSNGGTCTSLTGNPASGGSFSCSCPSSWQGFVDSTTSRTATNNCDAPTTLLRLRVLGASDLTLPAGLELRVADTPKGTTPSYALQAPSTLTCTLTGNPSTPAAPTCSTGGVTGAAGLPFLGTKVRLSTSYTGSEFTVEWACSDGVTGSAAALDIVLPGPTANNPNGQTTVCTAIFRRPDTGVAVRLALAPGSLVPEAATTSTAAQLTFSQGSNKMCAMDVSAISASQSAALPVNCPQAAYESAKSGSLGVSNVDMERYTVAWSCGGVAATTNAAGDAATPNLPAAGTTALVCAANFQLKATQVGLSALGSVATVPVKVTAKQAGMNEPCTATIPANTPVGQIALSLACPIGNLASGVTTTLETDADLTKYLVEFACTPSGATTATTARRTTTITSTPNGASSSAACTVQIKALPPLLSVRVVGAANAGAPSFSVWASQDESDTCVVASDTASPVLCDLMEGMMPGVTTTLVPRALDADKYELKWACTGATVAQDPYRNDASVVLNANPNLNGAQVVCTGTVTSRIAPLTLQLVADSTVVGPTTVLASAEARARQAHQSTPCKVGLGGSGAVAPTCTGEGLSAKNKRTTLTTGGVNLADYRVVWACAHNGVALTTTTVAAGVVFVNTQGDGTTVTCTATVSAKPALLTLAATGTGPTVEWRLIARQATQGLPCTVTVSSSTGVAATAPSCPGQPLVPKRSTVLSTSGLDPTRWQVVWACTSAGAPVALADALSSSGALLTNAQTVVLDKDINVGGSGIACVATVSARADVLLLKAQGTLPSSAQLTAKQQTQSSACTVSASVALSADGGAPNCPTGTTALTAGAAVELAAVGLPASSTVSWSCVARTPGIASASSLVVAQGVNSFVASLVPPEAPTVTTCTASVTAATSDLLRLVVSAGGGGATFTASQADTTVCSTTDNSSCPTVAAETATTLRAEGLSAGARARFSCEVNGKNVPVARTSATTAVVMSPPATESMTCTLVVQGKAPILTLHANVPTTLRAEVVGGAVCTSDGATNSLQCEFGTGSGQLPALANVVLSQTGLTATGFYRWACSSSSANIVRDNKTSYDTTATVTLPADGGALTCVLVYSQSAPTNGRALLRRMLF
jgi:hypothetical protein